MKEMTRRKEEEELMENSREELIQRHVLPNAQENCNKKEIEKEGERKMQQRMTLICERCKYITLVSSKEELELEEKKHSESCSGELKHPNGDCFVVAFQNVIKNPAWLFCYSFLIGPRGQKFLHAWNEGKGLIEKREGLEFVNLFSNQKIEEFVFDLSNNQRIVLRKEQYYQLNSIRESEIKKFNITEILDLMSKSIKEKEDLWAWLF